MLDDNGGTLGLTKIGSGVLTLTGHSTYSGPTHIDGGTVRLGATLPVANPLLWLDADDVSTVTESGGLVTQSRDKSGQSYLANASGAQVPRLDQQPAGRRQDRDAVRRLQRLCPGQLPGAAGASPYTMFAVEGRTSNKSSNYFLGTGPGGNNQSLHFGYRWTIRRLPWPNSAMT